MGEATEGRMSDTEKNFYVYLHRRKSDAVPFYVGKGKGGRAYAKDGRNPHWIRTVKKHGYEVEFVETDLSEVDAFSLEMELIAHYGRSNLKQGPLVNMSDGGEGPTGWIPSEETKAKISAANTGRDAPNKDLRVWTLVNVDTGEKQSGTREELTKSCGLIAPNALFSGAFKSTGGWALEGADLEKVGRGAAGRSRRIPLSVAQAVAANYQTLVEFRREQGSLHSICYRNAREGEPGWQELLDSLARSSRAGSGNPRHDDTVYSWKNKKGRVVEATRFEMKTRFNLPSSSTSLLISGNSRIQKGWFLADRFDSFEQIEALKRENIGASQRGKRRPDKGRPVICLTNNEQFESCADAAEWLGKARKFGIKISEAASGKRPRAGGHYWAFPHQ